MKLQEIIFKKPVKVLQVFRNINIYGKADKSFENRKGTMEWQSILSKSGYVSGDELFLPETFFDHNHPETGGIITLEDNNQTGKGNTPYLHSSKITGRNEEADSNRFFKTGSIAKLDIFEIKNELELFLKYDAYEVGIPERKNFKLCLLKPKVPVEIKINGKTDFSMTSGRQRVFKEQHYLFEYLGEYKYCKILKEPFAPMIKHVPEERKTVDLIKPLW
ncbi:MAG: hypothetical protein ABIR03_05230 [Ginsengibacter sp.]